MTGRLACSTTVSSPRSRSAQTQHQATRSRQYPAELITYRMGDEMVYVEPPKDYEQALEFAVRVFPSLSSVPRTRLAFQVNVRIGGRETLSKVRIAPMAWARAMKSLATYEIVEVVLLPELALPTTARRASRSETDLLTVPSYRTGCDDAPPKYNSTAVHCTTILGDLEKTARAASSSQPAAAPSPRRSTSPFSWLTRHF